MSSTNDAVADSQNSDDSGKVYDFKDSKTSGVVTVTKTWDDSMSNDERSVPDVSISTSKPSKNPLGYTITYHGNGLTFEDGDTENEIIVNSSGKVISGQYKELSTSSGWYSDSSCTNKIEINSSGFPVNGVTSDLDLYARPRTIILKKSVNFNNGTSFNSRIPSAATSIIFTDEAMPASAELIDVDADGDGGVVAWMDGTTMKISTQIKGLKVQANPDSHYMFYQQKNLKNIDLTMLDTQNVTTMNSMFIDCSGLTSLDLTPLDTHKVTDMASMFNDCRGLTNLDLTPLDTSNVTNMNSMFSGCSGLTSLDLTPLDTHNVINMKGMFSGCKGLINLDLSSMDTSQLQMTAGMFYECTSLISLDLSMLDFQSVSQISDAIDNSWSWGGMFQGCSSLKTIKLPKFTNKISNYSNLFADCNSLLNLDLSSMDASNVTNMGNMFDGCSGLKTLDLTSLDTQNVTNMGGMFYRCRKLTALDLTSLDTSKVTDMSGMFRGCSGLTSLDLSPLNTQNVTDMYGMFRDCSGLTTLFLTSLDTSKVTDMNGMFRGCRGLTSFGSVYSRYKQCY